MLYTNNVSTEGPRLETGMGNKKGTGSRSGQENGAPQVPPELQNAVFFFFSFFFLKIFLFMSSVLFFSFFVFFVFVLFFLFFFHVFLT